MALAHLTIVTLALLTTFVQQTTQRTLKQPKPTTPDYSLYHTKVKLLQEVQNIVAQNPKTMRIETKSASDGKYKADMMVVTVEPGGLSTDYQNRQRLFLDFGEHGREFISSELGLRFMQTLSNLTSLETLLGKEPGQRIQKLLSGVVFKILPLENVGGRDRVEQGQLCERKNGRGVDPNRNWEVDWGKKEKDYDPNEEYPGTGPFSEPEVQMVRTIAQELKPHAWVNIHSGMDAMFVPYDHKAEVATDASQALAIIRKLNAEIFQNSVVVDAGGKGVGYLAHGTATDYMFDKLHIPITYTWEIYGDMKAPYNDCFKMFNPVTKDSFETVLKNWLKALFLLVDYMQGHSAVPKNSALIASSTNTTAATPSATRTSVPSPTAIPPPRPLSPPSSSKIPSPSQTPSPSPASAGPTTTTTSTTYGPQDRPHHSRHHPPPPSTTSPTSSTTTTSTTTPTTTPTTKLPPSTSTPTANVTKAASMPTSTTTSFATVKVPVAGSPPSMDNSTSDVTQNNLIVITLNALPWSWSTVWPHTLLAASGIVAVTIMLIRYLMMTVR